MTYEDALAYVASLEPRGWRLGLDRMQEFVRRAGLEGSLGELGGPQFIHVAGTNGKGSVTAYLQSMMVECGYRTGAFFSPYVLDPRERVQIGRELIAKREFARLTAELKPAAESLSETDFGGVTEFEFKTALGFAAWKSARCDWVALEVGLGGRLDATNVVHPRACAIVSIGLDHTSILGGTLGEIAREKAGIIKTGVPVVVGQMPDEAREVILGMAEGRAAPVWSVGQEVGVEEGSVPGTFRVTTPVTPPVEIKPALFGKAQGHNAAVAYAAIIAAGAGQGKSLVCGIACVSLPGRFQRVVIGPRSEVVLDGAHNRDAAEELRANLALLPTPERTVLVTGMVAGHDPRAFYEPLRPFLKHVHVCPIDSPRAMPPKAVAEALRSLGAESVTVHESAVGALSGGMAELTREPVGGRVVVTGSFYLVGEVAPAILSPPRR